MKISHLIAIAVLCAGMLAGGCSKKVQITVRNHTDVSRPVQLTVPDGTMALGSVGPNSSLTSTLKVKTDDLPAPCNISAGGGASQSFTVTEDSPSAWWFHITGAGRMAGPYGKDDVHTETEDRGTIVVPAGRRMLVK